MSDKKKYTVLNILADDVVINIDEKLTPEEALERYLELKVYADEIDVPTSLIFLIEGNIIRKNKKTIGE